MKKIITFIILLGAILSISCDALNTVTSNKVNSQGSPYELIVVCNQPEWEGALGDTLKTILRAEIPYLVQPEPYFSVYRITQQGYDNLILKHRNIFIVNVVPSLDESSIVVQYDVNATPQIIMTLQGPTAESLTEYVSENRELVMKALEGAERDRDIAYGQKFSVATLDKLIKDKFDVTMKIPQGYSLRNEGKDFVWLSYEYPTASQGVILYSYPAEDGKASLKWEALLEARNKFASKIPGPSEGSYMTTFMEVEPDYRLFRSNGRVWAEMRGLWEVEGDYMGGPFVSFSTIDTRTNRVFAVDCYVYSPKLGKRNFLRGVEHIVYNVEIPTE
ncbi:MAG: DUF4837 family protein [Rikenellaceae bacterium]